MEGWKDTTGKGEQGKGLTVCTVPQPGTVPLLYGWGWAGCLTRDITAYRGAPQRHGSSGGPACPMTKPPQPRQARLCQHSTGAPCHRLVPLVALG